MRTEAPRLDLSSDRCADEPIPVPSQEGNSLAVRSDKLPSLGGVGGGFGARARTTPPPSVVRMLPGLGDKKAATGDETGGELPLPTHSGGEGLGEGELW